MSTRAAVPASGGTIHWRWWCPVFWAAVNRLAETGRSGADMSARAVRAEPVPA